MIFPQAKDIVKIIFSSGLSLEGEVESWSAEQAILRTEGDEFTVLINKPVDNILAVKICNKVNPVKKDKPVPAIQKEILEGLKNPNREDFTKHSLPQLAAELKQQELRDFTAPLRSFQVKETQSKYEYPSFIPVQRPVERSSEEDCGEVKPSNPGVSNLFRKRR
jgi:hypothetical protein